MVKNTILSKIIIYNYLYNNVSYKSENFMSDVTLSIRTIARQFPFYIFNNKKEVIGTKTTLLGKNINYFLYKFREFTLVKLYNTSIFHKNMYNLDSNFNLNICFSNKSYFFEYFNVNIRYSYKFNIKIIFNKYTSNINKLNYLINNLNFKLTNK